MLRSHKRRQHDIKSHRRIVSRRVIETSFFITALVPIVIASRPTSNTRSHSHAKCTANVCIWSRHRPHGSWAVSVVRTRIRRSQPFSVPKKISFLKVEWKNCWDDKIQFDYLAEATSPVARLPYWLGLNDQHNSGTYAWDQNGGDTSIPVSHHCLFFFWKTVYR
jgi:hypothetical protein